MKKAAIVMCLFWLGPGILWAQSNDAREERLKALEERVRALEAEIQALKAGQSAAAPAAMTAAPVAAPAVVQAPAGAGSPGVALPVYGGASAMAKVLNPDIGVIGNFLGAVGRNTVRPVSGLEMRESEVSFQAIIDPYARADFFLSFGESGVNVEEGFLTFTSLPGGLVAKVGKMRASFGKVNTLHAHSLPWTDRPMATENLLGGEDGINDAGFSLSRILPAPKGVFLEATGQVFRGDSEGIFEAHRRTDASVVGHLRGYGDLSESTNLDLGFSFARGHNEDRLLTRLYGVDAALRWKPLRRAIYHSFLLRSEFFWSHRDQLPAVERAFGFYVAPEYRVNRRWTLGGRYDRSGRADEASLTDRGFSALLTYWPSEFSQIRGQYRFGRYAERRDSNELRFQFLFIIGAHGAHPF